MLRLTGWFIDFKITSMHTEILKDPAGHSGSDAGVRD